MRVNRPKFVNSISITIYLECLYLNSVSTCQFSFSKHSYHYVEFTFSEKIKSEKVLYLICLLSLCPLEKELHGLNASKES